MAQTFKKRKSSEKKVKKYCLVCLIVLFETSNYGVAPSAETALWKRRSGSFFALWNFSRCPICPIFSTNYTFALTAGENKAFLLR